MPTAFSEKYKAPALEKGLEIIEYLALQTTAQSQSEIALGLNRSTNEIYRMLSLLEQRGYIYRDAVSSKYSLSLKLYYLSRRHPFVEKLRAASLKAMSDCTAQIQESCHLSVLYDTQVLVIASSKSPRPIAVMIGEGNLYSATATASGQVLLSYSETEIQTNILEQYDDYKHLNKAQRTTFHQVLANIKEKGYYETPSAYAQGVLNISVPIGNTETGIIACLTTSKLMRVQADENLPNELIRTALLNCKALIEENLGLSKES